MSGSVKHVFPTSDPGWEDDNRWFASHPGREFRLRRMLSGEFAGDAFSGVKEAGMLQAGGRFLVLVAVLDAENRLRLPFPAPPGTPIPRDLDAATDEVLSGMFGLGETIAATRGAKGE